jgi:hypothetical protein
MKKHTKIVIILLATMPVAVGAFAVLSGQTGSVLFINSPFPRVENSARKVLNSQNLICACPS